jgi:hypothetical protein
MTWPLKPRTVLINSGQPSQCVEFIEFTFGFMLVTALHLHKSKFWKGLPVFLGYAHEATECERIELKME